MPQRCRLGHRPAQSPPITERMQRAAAQLSLPGKDQGRLTLGKERGKVFFSCNESNSYTMLVHRSSHAWGHHWGRTTLPPRGAQEHFTPGWQQHSSCPCHLPCPPWFQAVTNRLKFSFFTLNLRGHLAEFQSQSEISYLIKKDAPDHLSFLQQPAHVIA